MIYVKLSNKVRHHDWTSAHPRDIMERMDLMRELRQIPQRNLAEILKKVTPEVAHIITTLVPT